MQELSLKDIQHESLKILKDIHLFCAQKGIVYSVAYGTLLGTVRHKGFIPWDDDIDIIMPRQQYEWFCREYKSERFKIKSPEVDDDCMIAFTRVYDDSYTVSNSVVPWCGTDVGVWVDIFPVDSVSDVESDFLKMYNKIKFIWKESLYTRSACGQFRKEESVVSNLKLLVKKIIFGRQKKANQLARKQVGLAKRYSWNETNHWSQLACMDEFEYHISDAFSSVVLMPFEDMEVMVMNGWDTVLKECYGDYMQLPPIENRVPKINGQIRFYWK